jgi:hypothetical protein
MKHWGKWRNADRTPARNPVPRETYFEGIC